MSGDSCPTFVFSFSLGFVVWSSIVRICEADKRNQKLKVAATAQDYFQKEKV